MPRAVPPAASRLRCHLYMTVCVSICVYANIPISQLFFWKVVEKLLCQDTDNDKDIR